MDNLLQQHQHAQALNQVLGSLTATYERLNQVTAGTSGNLAKLSSAIGHNVQTWSSLGNSLQATGEKLTDFETIYARAQGLLRNSTPLDSLIEGLNQVTFTVQGHIIIQKNWLDTIATTAAAALQLPMTIVESYRPLGLLLSGLIGTFSILLTRIQHTNIAQAMLKNSTHAHTAAIRSFTVATWSLNTAMAANPIMRMGAGIETLIVGMVIAWKKVDGLFLNLWNTIKSIDTGMQKLFNMGSEDDTRATSTANKTAILIATKPVESGSGGGLSSLLPGLRLGSKVQSIPNLHLATGNIPDMSALITDNQAVPNMAIPPHASPTVPTQQTFHLHIDSIMKETHLEVGNEEALQELEENLMVKITNMLLRVVQEASPKLNPGLTTVYAT